MLVEITPLDGPVKVTTIVGLTPTESIIEAPHTFECEELIGIEPVQLVLDLP